MIIEWISVVFIAFSKFKIGRKHWYGWGIAAIGYALACYQFAMREMWGFTAYTIFMIWLSAWYGFTWYREHKNGN